MIAETAFEGCCGALIISNLNSSTTADLQNLINYYLIDNQDENPKAMLLAISSTENSKGVPAKMRAAGFKAVSTATNPQTRNRLTLWVATKASKRRPASKRQKT